MPAVRGVLRRRYEETPRIANGKCIYRFAARRRSVLPWSVHSPSHRAPGFIPRYPVERIRLHLPRGLLEDEVTPITVAGNTRRGPFESFLIRGYSRTPGNHVDLVGRRESKSGSLPLLSNHFTPTNLLAIKCSLGSNNQYCEEGVAI